MRSTPPGERVVVGGKAMVSKRINHLPLLPILPTIERSGQYWAKAIIDPPAILVEWVAAVGADVDQNVNEGDFVEVVFQAPVTLDGFFDALGFCEKWIHGEIVGLFNL